MVLLFFLLCVCVFRGLEKQKEFACSTPFVLFLLLVLVLVVAAPLAVSPKPDVEFPWFPKTERKIWSLRGASHFGGFEPTAARAAHGLCMLWATWLMKMDHFDVEDAESLESIQWRLLMKAMVGSLRSSGGAGIKQITTVEEKPISRMVILPQNLEAHLAKTIAKCMSWCG